MAQQIRPSRGLSTRGKTVGRTESASAMGSADRQQAVTERRRASNVNGKKAAPAMPGTVRRSYDPRAFFDGNVSPSPLSQRKNPEADDIPMRSPEMQSSREIAARRARLTGRKL